MTKMYVVINKTIGDGLVVALMEGESPEDAVNRRAKEVGIDHVVAVSDSLPSANVGFGGRWLRPVEYIKEPHLNVLTKSVAKSL